MHPEEVLDLDREIRKSGARTAALSLAGLIVCGALFYQLLITTGVIKEPASWWPNCDNMPVLCLSHKDPAPTTKPKHVEKEFPTTFAPRTTFRTPRSRGQSVTRSNQPRFVIRVPDVPKRNNVPRVPSINTDDIQKQIDDITKTVPAPTPSVPIPVPKVEGPDVQEPKAPEIKPPEPKVEPIVEETQKEVESVVEDVGGLVNSLGK